MRAAAVAKRLAAGLLWLAATGAVATEVGTPAPAFSLPARDGGQASLADLRGRVVYLDFWASWCAPCRRSFPWMSEMQARHGERGLRVIAVNLDAERKDAEAFLAAHPPGFTVLLDPSAATAARYDVKGMPTSYLIGRDGVVRRVHRGFRDDHKAPLEQAIVEALTIKETR
jgi:peroxiredoxin